MVITVMNLLLLQLPFVNLLAQQTSLFLVISIATTTFTSSLGNFFSFLDDILRHTETHSLDNYRDIVLTFQGVLNLLKCITYS